MTDSFFTAENMFDVQVRAQKMNALSAQELTEAGVRRLVALEGPVNAAKRLYRLADVCASAYVLPDKFWEGGDAGGTAATTSNASAEITRRKRRWAPDRFTAVSMLVFGAMLVAYGLGVGH